MFAIRGLYLPLVACLSAVLPGTPASATSEAVIHSFMGTYHHDGATPLSGLINIGGTLYGTTSAGGDYGSGVVFRLTPKGIEKVLYAFKGQGTTRDGGYCLAGLANLGGVLYGTTQLGGLYNDGAVFKVTLAGAEKILHSFKGAPPGDGQLPAAGLVNLGGTLYGTTTSGGAYNAGTIFKITAAGGEKVLHALKGYPTSDGGDPVASLVDIDGVLYGTTSGGGTYGFGTVFKITTAGAARVLHAFKGYPTDGGTPRAALINVGGKLYGTTSTGGTYGQGTVFRMTTAGAETALYSFKEVSGDGRIPNASLTYLGGVLYGTTSQGGAEGKGTVFKVTTGGAEMVLHSFGKGNDGATPQAGLVALGGALYGTTTLGGTLNNNGTVFKLTP